MGISKPQVGEVRDSAKIEHYNFTTAHLIGDLGVE